ncbi:hypothetical protein FGO68_gene4541 [Halteria grandinella]|uniref:Uncharacterized protein n=1 Tax=Halteria grandinella TaxID=5974 RepID=A0A8J8P008_HALGN|nr:hypothetical protein FGO68_gene4541 [Halteria grandinella]
MQSTLVKRTSHYGFTTPATLTQLNRDGNAQNLSLNQSIHSFQAIGSENAQRVIVKCVRKSVVAADCKVKIQLSPLPLIKNNDESTTRCSTAATATNDNQTYQQIQATTVAQALQNNLQRQVLFQNTSVITSEHISDLTEDEMLAARCLCRMASKRFKSDQTKAEPVSFSNLVPTATNKKSEITNKTQSSDCWSNQKEKVQLNLIEQPADSKIQIGERKNSLVILPLTQTRTSTPVYEGQLGANLVEGGSAQDQQQTSKTYISIPISIRPKSPNTNMQTSENSMQLDSSTKIVAKNLTNTEQSYEKPRQTETDFTALPMPTTLASTLIKLPSLLGHPQLNQALTVQGQQQQPAQSNQQFSSSGSSQYYQGEANQSHQISMLQEMGAQCTHNPSTPTFTTQQSDNVCHQSNLGGQYQQVVASPQQQPIQLFYHNNSQAVQASNNHQQNLFISNPQSLGQQFQIYNNPAQSSQNMYTQQMQTPSNEQINAYEQQLQYQNAMSHQQLQQRIVVISRRRNLTEQSGAHALPVPRYKLSSISSQRLQPEYFPRRKQQLIEIAPVLAELRDLSKLWWAFLLVKGRVW